MANFTNTTDSTNTTDFPNMTNFSNMLNFTNMRTLINMTNSTTTTSSYSCPEVDEGGLILPIIPCEYIWNRSVRASLYCFGMFYCFMGIAIVADIFMVSIEKITSKTRKVYLSTSDGGLEVIQVKIWNDTVANLTLMALGSSAPEILLSCIEIIGKGFTAGDLGPGTIVGSAAFNLLIICAVCIMGIPKGETRTIKMFNVFVITTGFSVFAYLWIVIVVLLISPDEVEIWEAALTLVMFPILVLMAWWADRDFIFCSRRRAAPVADQQVELGNLVSRTAESTLERERQLFQDNGEVNKEALVEFYKDLKKFSHLSDSDAALLTATKLIDSQPHSRMWYRIGAIRGISGSKKVHPALPDNLRMVYETINAHPDTPDLGQIRGTELTHGKAVVEFSVARYAALENIGKFQVTVMRSGRLDNTARVRVESFDGTAKVGSDYVAVNEEVVFEPNVTEQDVTIQIVDDDQWEPDEEFFLRLSVEAENREEVMLGKLPIMEIIILNDDEPGYLSFRRRGIMVKEGCETAHIDVERHSGADGEVSVQWKTIEGTAKSPKDFEAAKGKLVFKSGETLQTIEVQVVDEKNAEKGERCFEIELTTPEGGVKLGRITTIAVTITNDDDFDSVFKSMMTLNKPDALEDQNKNWNMQFRAALTVNGGDVENATNFDYFMHFIMFGWKVIFALIPPPCYCGGWLCFFCSLGAIGILTAIVGDLAEIFGSLVGLQNSVTAITFVALGTSLPDLFASRTAAAMEDTADNAVGNVTGSNSVNVFLGLGLPWLMAAIYHASHNRKFVVQAGSLAYSVTVYSAVAFVGLAVIVLRRYLPMCGKAELGGPTIPKYISGVIMIVLWFIYIILSSLQVYKLIAGF